MKKNKSSTIIYKYRSWENEDHKRILTHNELFLSSAKDFNDPFDCRIPKDYLSLQESNKLEAYLEKMTLLQLRNYGEIRTSKEEVRNKIMINLPEYQKLSEKIDKDAFDKYFGICCLSLIWNSILMWSHYGDFHKGFCVGFDEEKILNSGYFSKGGLVKYKKDMPLIDPTSLGENIENGFIKSHTKAEDWRYEQEYRIMKIFFPNEPSKDDRTISLEDDFIKEVILGLEISKQNEFEILKICKSKKIKVFRCSKVPFRFELKRDEIIL